MKSKKRLLFVQKASKEIPFKKSECSKEDVTVPEVINWTDSFGFTIEHQDSLDIDNEVSRIKKLMTLEETEVEVLSQDKIVIEENELNFQEILAERCLESLPDDKSPKQMTADIDDDLLSVEETISIEAPAPQNPHQQQPQEFIKLPSDLPKHSIPPQPTEPIPTHITDHDSISQPTRTSALHTHQVSSGDKDIDDRVAESIMNVLTDKCDSVCHDEHRIDLHLDDQLPADVHNVAKVMMAVLTGKTLISHISPPNSLPSSLSQLPTPLAYLLSIRPRHIMPATYISHCTAAHGISDRLDDGVMADCFDADIRRHDACHHAAIVCRYVRDRHMLVCHARVADIVKTAMEGLVMRNENRAGDVFLEVSRAWKRVRHGELGKEQKEVSTLVWIECALEYLKVNISQGNQELVETIIKLISQHTYELPQDKSKSIGVRFRLFREAYTTTMQPQPDSQQNTFFNSFINRFVKN